MSKRGLGIAAFCAVLGLFQAYGESITLLVVQNEKAPAVALDMSRTVEDELFGLFFNAGHIVSNEDIRFDGSRYAEQVFGVKEAAFGYSDYLVVVLLNYGTEEKKALDNIHTYAELLSITWKLVRVATSEKLMEKTIELKNMQLTESDPYAQSRILIGQSFPDMLQAIRNNGTGGKR